MRPHWPRSEAVCQDCRLQAEVTSRLEETTSPGSVYCWPTNSTLKAGPLVLVWLSCYLSVPGAVGRALAPRCRPGWWSGGSRRASPSSGSGLSTSSSRSVPCSMTNTFDLPFQLNFCLFSREDESRLRSGKCKVFGDLVERFCNLS